MDPATGDMDPATGAEPADLHDGTAGFDPEVLTGWTLVRAYHAMARRFYESFAEVDLTPSRFGVLAQLARQPGTSQATLARSVFMTPQAMGEMLSGLNHDGLVERPAAARGRPIAVTLTDAGRLAVQRAIPVVAALNEPRALGLEIEEAVTLNALLHKVQRAVADRTEDG